MYEANLIESRYPKLLYAYKKFFHNLDKIRKNQTVLDTGQDLYVKDKSHSLVKYEISLKQVNKILTKVLRALNFI